MVKQFAAAVAVIVLLTVGAILIVHRLTEPPPPGPASSASAAAPVERPADDPTSPAQAVRAANGLPANGTLGAPVPVQAAPAQVAPPTESDESEQPPPANRRRTRVPRIDRSKRVEPEE